MVLTPHAIVGATLTNIFPNHPILGFILAFLSHYALDLLPHNQYAYDTADFILPENESVRSIIKNAWKSLKILFLVFDMAFAFILCLLFFVRSEKSLFLTFLGIMGGTLPDFITFFYHKCDNALLRFIKKIHTEVQYHIDGHKFEIILGPMLQFLIPICFLILYFTLKI